MESTHFYISKGAHEVFYTLRKTVQSKRYNSSRQAYLTTEDLHVCTLAQELEAAKVKAKKTTGVDCEFDPESVGIRVGNSNYKQEELILDLDTATFSYGKHSGKLVLDVIVEDLDYMMWYNKNAYGAEASAIQKLLKDLPLFNDAVKVIEDQRVAEKEAKLSKIKELGAKGERVEAEILIGKVYFDYSLEHGEEVCMIRGYVGEIEYDHFNNPFSNHVVYLKLTDFKHMEYRGMSYPLPIINGKARRLKNKTVKLVATVGEYEMIGDDTKVVNLFNPEFIIK
jgi:hypothetical protein